MKLTKVTITIPTEKYEYIRGLESNITDYATTQMLYTAVRNGSTSPVRYEEGMRLIDANSLKSTESIQSANFNSIENIRAWIDSAPTVEDSIAYNHGYCDALNEIG